MSTGPNNPWDTLPAGASLTTTHKAAAPPPPPSIGDVLTTAAVSPSGAQPSTAALQQSLAGSQGTPVVGSAAPSGMASTGLPYPAGYGGA